MRLQTLTPLGYILLLFACAVLCGSVVLMFFVPSKDWGYITAPGYLLELTFLAFLFLKGLWPKTNMGSLLYLVSREKIIYGMLGIILIMCLGITISNIWVAIEFRGLQFEQVVNALSFGLLYLILAGYSLKRVEIRENGLRDFLTFVKWEDIESYSWTGLAYQNLTLKFKNPKILKTRSFLIPLNDGVAVNRIMVEKVLGWKEHLTSERQG